jgi:hypothetical protein
MASRTHRVVDDVTDEDSLCRGCRRVSLTIRSCDRTAPRRRGCGLSAFGVAVGYYEPEFTDALAPATDTESATFGLARGELNGKVLGPVPTVPRLEHRHDAHRRQSFMLVLEDMGVGLIQAVSAVSVLAKLVVVEQLARYVVGPPAQTHDTPRARIAHRSGSRPVYSS